MLFELLNQVINKINALDEKNESPLLLKELKRGNPVYWDSLQKNLKKKGIKDDSIRVVEQAIATGILINIKKIPEIVNTMVSMINDNRTDPAIRCAFVGSLALLVKPRDLIHDDAPGGHGFLDDTILLRATLIKYLEYLPKGLVNFEEEMKTIQLISVGIPINILPAMQSAIEGIEYGVMILNQLPPFILDTTTQMLIQNPMLAEIQTPPGTQMSDAFHLPSQGHLTQTMAGTTYTEGGNISVNFPDGDSIFMSESGDILINN